MAKVGRPNGYKEEFCKQLIDHMSRGLSYEAFAGKLHISRETLYDWERKHPEFSDTKKIADRLCQLWWEKAGIKGMVGKFENFNAAVWIFNMKNRFKWRDRNDLVIEGNVSVTTEQQKKEKIKNKVSELKLMREEVKQLTPVRTLN